MVSKLLTYPFYRMIENARLKSQTSAYGNHQQESFSLSWVAWCLIDSTPDLSENGSLQDSRDIEFKRCVLLGQMRLVRYLINVFDVIMLYGCFISGTSVQYHSKIQLPLVADQTHFPGACRSSVKISSMIDR